MEQKKQTVSHLYAQVSRTYFSAERPSGAGSYALMYVQMNGDYTTLKFKQGVTSENSFDLNCWIPPQKAFDLARWLEGFMGRRRDEYDKTGKYTFNQDDILKIPLTKYENGKDTITGILTCEPYMYDSVPRLRITFQDLKENKSISIVFATYVNNNHPIETKQKFDINIDYADYEAFEFTLLLKELQQPLVPIIYRIQDAAVSTIIRYVRACFANKPGGTGYINKNGYNNANNFKKPAEIEDSSPSWEVIDEPF